MSTVYWIEEAPGKFAAFHEALKRDQVKVIEGLGKVLVLYSKTGWPTGAVRIVAEQEWEPSMAVQE